MFAQNTKPISCAPATYASRCVVLAVATVMIIGLQSNIALGKSPLGQRWPASQRVAMNEIDHTRFDQVLKKYVDKNGFVDYSALQRSSAGRRDLKAYLSELSRASPGKRSSREAKLAFWINAYNAVTLEGILQVYPTTSIRNHTARVFGYNIWKELPLIVGGGQHSLENIEHQILRKMGEPRIHFAIVCASIGCPRLRNEAYTASQLDQQLSDNVRDFFTRSKHFRFNAKRRTMQVSSILKWFGEDFGRTQVARFTYLQKYLPQPARKIAVDSRTRITYLDYDWNLNDKPHR